MIKIVERLIALHAHSSHAWRSCMLLALLISTPFSSSVHGAEPELDCNQFVAKEANPGSDFKPEWFTAEMAQWDRSRQFAEGLKHFSNKDSSEELQKALYWFCWSAVFGDSRAERMIANLYREGTGVPKDSSMAFKWMLKAAKDGDRRAQSIVSEMYASGEGTEKNEIEAKKWEDIERKRWLRKYESVKKIMELRNRELRNSDAASK